MTTIRFYNPLYSANRDENNDAAIEKLFSHFNRNDYCGYRQVPAANISETDKDYLIEMALPGVEKNHISIRHENGLLHISVDNQEEKGEKYDHREFDYKGASRVFKTGEKIDADRITAKYESGILTVSLPKKEAYVNKPAQSIAIN
jgi:HSP20 family protein